MEKHRVHYQGEGGGFLQVQAMVNLMSPSLPLPRPSTKSAPTCTNQFIVWFVQVRVNK